MTSLLSDDDDLMAAEYVLGVTDIAARQAAEARAKRDPAFAARIADWEAHFAGLNAEMAEVPAPDLMPQIEARLFPQGPSPLRQGSRWARFWGFGPALAAVVLAAWFAFVPTKPELVAILAPQAQGVSYKAALTAGELTITMVAGQAPDDTHDYELWIIRGTAAPVSLGVLPADGERITLADAGDGAVLAVTLEPKGGSPTGQPTGPIVAAGPLQKA
jgi:anti-sigma-K factor RskA